MKLNIFKGDRPSNGARNLQEALGATMLKSTGSKYSGRQDSCIINWGCTNLEAHRLAGIAGRANRQFLNKPEAIELCTNKLEFFKMMQEHLPDHLIPYVENYQDALELVVNGSRMYARTVLNSHSGKGIVLMLNNRDLETQAVAQVRRSETQTYIIGENNERVLHEKVVNTKLFTQGVQGRRDEYRVHVFRDAAILVQQKKRGEGWQGNPNYNSIVRNVASGWIYAVNDVDGLGKDACIQAAIKAVGIAGLDFGAVDLVFKHDNNKAYVLEINTAPGLDEDGSALAAYKEAFKNV
ncbi:putative glutathione synthase/RimK-type ligase [Pseudomonas phage BroderSalsa]|nr:putative glutathione synthase/RimK-type ligase [Pseudomonas phage BroderSalsa]